MNIVRFHIRTVMHLLQADLQLFFASLTQKAIDLFIWVSCTIGVMGYIMPAVGLSADFGNFQLASSIASAGLFEVFPHVMQLVSDLEGNNTISYQLTLPIPSWLVFVKTMMYYTICSTILSLITLPFGKLILWNTFSLSQVSFFKLLIMLITSGTLYAAITLLLAAHVKHMGGIGHVWTRCIFPLWFLGGFQFSWATLRGLAPALAYADLVNPIIYVMEGFRAAVIGQEGFLPFWICALMLSIISVAASWWAIKKLKRRIDFV